MTDSELEDRLFTYLWLSFHTPNAHAGRVAQLIEEAERRGQAGIGRKSPREGRDNAGRKRNVKAWRRPLRPSPTVSWAKRYAGTVNDKEFRQYLAELLARQRNPDQPAKKDPPTPEPLPKPATMSNKEFRQHIRQLLARQANESQPPAVEKKPPKISEASNSPATEPPARKPPASANITRGFNVRRKSR